MSRPYFVYAQQILTRKETLGLARLEELKGKNVGVLSSSVAQRLLEQTSGAQLKIYPGNVETLRDLKARRIDAVVLDLPIALHYAGPDPTLKFSGSPFAPGYYAIGLRKQDVMLIAALNGALADLTERRTLECIYRKYGVWDERQAALQGYKPEVIPAAQSHSTLRELPFEPLVRWRIVHFLDDIAATNNGSKAYIGVCGYVFAMAS